MHDNSPSQTEGDKNSQSLSLSLWNLACGNGLGKTSTMWYNWDIDYTWTFFYEN